MILFQLKFFLRKNCIYNFDVGIIEYPNFQTSTRGLISAQRGYTFELAFIAGALYGTNPGATWFMPTPVEWKGQQPKEAVGKKFGKWQGVDYRTIPDHAYEAAMMIKWYLDNVSR